MDRTLMEGSVWRQLDPIPNTELEKRSFDAAQVKLKLTCPLVERPMVLPFGIVIGVAVQHFI